MTNVLQSDFIPFLRAEVPEIPEIIAQQYLIRSAREFFEKSQALSNDMVLSFIRGRRTYGPLYDGAAIWAGSQIGQQYDDDLQDLIGLRYARLASTGEELIPTTPTQLNKIYGKWHNLTGTPKYYYWYGPEDIAPVPRPDWTDTRDIQGITLNANDPVVVTLSTETLSGITSHHYAVGETVKFYDIVGTTELHGEPYQISARTDTTITLKDEYGNDTDSANFSAWSSLGTCQRASLYMECIVKPSFGTANWSENITQRFFEPITSGALMYLYGTPSKPWTNGDLFLYHKANFERAIDTAMARSQDRYAKGVPRSIQYGGVGSDPMRKTRYGSR